MDLARCVAALRRDKDPCATRTLASGDVDAFARAGQWSAVRRMLDRGHYATEQTLHAAARAGRVDLLRVLCDRYGLEPTWATATQAAVGGHPAVLAFLRAKFPATYTDFAPSGSLVMEALRHNRVAVLDYLASIWSRDRMRYELGRTGDAMRDATWTLFGALRRNAREALRWVARHAERPLSEMVSVSTVLHSGCDAATAELVLGSLAAEAPSDVRTAGLAGDLAAELSGAYATERSRRGAAVAGPARLRCILRGYPDEAAVRAHVRSFLCGSLWDPPRGSGPLFRWCLTGTWEPLLDPAGIEAAAISLGGSKPPAVAHVLAIAILCSADEALAAARALPHAMTFEGLILASLALGRSSWIKAEPEDRVLELFEALGERFPSAAPAGGPLARAHRGATHELVKALARRGFLRALEALAEAGSRGRGFWDDVLRAAAAADQGPLVAAVAPRAHRDVVEEEAHEAVVYPRPRALDALLAYLCAERGADRLAALCASVLREGNMASAQDEASVLAIVRVLQRHLGEISAMLATRDFVWWGAPSELIEELCAAAGAPEDEVLREALGAGLLMLTMRFGANHGAVKDIPPRLLVRMLRTLVLDVAESTAAEDVARVARDNMVRLLCAVGQTGTVPQIQGLVEGFPWDAAELCEAADRIAACGGQVGVPRLLRTYAAERSATSRRPGMAAAVVAAAAET